MNDLLKRLRARTVPQWTHATCGTPVMHGHKPDPLCLEAADRLDQIRVLVEAVRDANARACSAGDRWHLSTEAQGQAWIRLMEAL